MKQHISWLYHIEYEDMKLTKLVLHFSDFSAIFYAFYKHYCSVLIGSFRFLPTRGARPTQNKCVGSCDKVSEVSISTFSAKNRKPYCEETNQPKSKPF